MKPLSPIYIGSLWAASAHCGLAASVNTNATKENPVLLLSSDPSFHFELLVPLGEATYGGADVGPILGVAKNIIPGDMGSFSDQFHALANSTKAQAEDPDNAYDPINVRDSWFSAATYFRRADFYLHGNWSNPLINSLWAEQRAAFDTALATLPIPGERVRIHAPKADFYVEAIWYAASESKDTKRPTLIIGNGYDAAQEDSYHAYVIPALARGWNCLTYEGPGQPTVLRDQDIGFIPDWEQAVTPTVDYLLSHKSHVVDESHLVLLGNSMGGYLAARAAAFEPRLSALLLVDGVWDLYSAYSSQLPPSLVSLFEGGNQTGFDNEVSALRSSSDIPTTEAWGVDQGLWSFRTHSPFEWFTQLKDYHLRDVIDNINMPVWIGDAEQDAFFPGQPQQVKDALGDKATLHKFIGVNGYHCQVGAAQGLAVTMFAWLNKTLG